MFDDSRRNLSLAKLSAIQEGISPEKLFPPRSRVINRLQFRRNKGKVPLNLLLAMCSDSRVAVRVLEIGNEPLKEFLDKSMNHKVGKSHRQSSRSPYRALFDRSRRYR
jgi:hypothetical protein